ncbi:MucR family transcriptional regulator [Nocardiopsis sp. NPDC007018]|uniref:MucR family transcriptional regulator n=1 Tax=Nocardiopsis sp. NPDC007018 TaxID=3155721 RepID=UPI0033E5B383
MVYGDPDGHGVYGQLTTGDDGGLICHECGQERQFLGRHVREHGMTAESYREAHGLGRGTSLAAPALRLRFGALASERVGSPEWERFAASRNHEKARRKSRAAFETPLRAETSESRRQQALAASRSRPPRVCEVPGCGRKHVSRGWCGTHLERYRRHGDVQADIPVRPRRGGPKPR